MLLLWCVSMKQDKYCPCEECNNKAKRGQILSHGSTLIPLWTYCSLILKYTGRHKDGPPRLSCCVSAASCWSEAEDIVPERAETVGSVSISAVPVRFSEPVLGSQPNVQDLGVSTRHCQAEETEEKR